MCFLGNPGTGTEVARSIAGILWKWIFCPLPRSLGKQTRDLLQATWSNSDQRPQRSIPKYLWAGAVRHWRGLVQNDTGRSYGHEAVSTLIKSYGGHQRKFCVILAGYKNPNEMIATNQGFQSGIGFTLDFQITTTRNCRRSWTSCWKQESIPSAMLLRSVCLLLPTTSGKTLILQMLVRSETFSIRSSCVRMYAVQAISDKALEIVDVNTYIRDEHINIPQAATVFEEDTYHRRRTWHTCGTAFRETNDKEDKGLCQA